MPQMPGMSAMRSADGRDRAVARRGADDLDEACRCGCRSRPRRSARRSRPSRSRCRRGRPSRRAHSSLRVPGRTVRADRPCRRADRAASASFGSSRARNAFDGRPPHVSEYIALWPAAQMQRTICARVVDAGEDAPARSRRARPSSPRRRRRPARPSGSARSSTTTTPTSTCRRSARGTAARARAAIAVMAAASSADGVVLPEPRVRGEVVLPPRVERERARLRVDRQRRRAGRVDADADHLSREKPGVARGLGERAA